MDGELIRTGGSGVSGTEQSAVLVAEHLAGKGHDVAIVTFNANLSFEKVRGVWYTNFTYMGLQNIDVDLLVVHSMHTIFRFPFQSVRCLVTWCVCAGIQHQAAIARFVAEKKCTYGIVHISKWAEAVTRVDIPVHFAVQIPNPVMFDVLERFYDTPKKPKSMVFHAVWERGGDVARRVYDKLGWASQGGTFSVFDYNIPEKSADKFTVLQTVAESEYFVFPLVLPSGSISKETFACVAAEACALGAILITIGCGSLPQFYGQSAVFVPFPADCDVHGVVHASSTTDVRFLSEDMVDQYVAIINYLESNPDKKARIRKAAKENMQQFSIESVGVFWSQLVEKI